MDIIDQMGENFEEKRSEIEKEEMTKSFAFDSIMQELTSTITDATREREEKASRSQDVGQAKAEAQGELQQTKADLAADSKFLSDLNNECQTKAEDYEKRQVIRAGEIEALSKAIEIMSGAAVSTGSQHLPSLVQDGTSLVQLRSIAVSPVQKNAAAFLAERAKSTNSRLLSVIAQRVQADPFGKVTKMIEEMIQKLMTEGNEEAEHKGFCDTEMGTNKQTRDQKSDEVDALTARSEKLTADIKQLAEEIAVLGDELAVIDAQVTKATAERSAEKEKNAVTIKDAKGGQQATLMALNVLREFYGKQAEAAALAQMQSGARVPGAPPTGDATYSGMGSASGGVIGMLEVIESDFARLDAETTASEAEADGAYNKFMTDSEKDKSVKTTDMNFKSNEKTKSEAELLETGKDLKTTKEELAAAMEYFDKLKPSCVEAGVSYEDRVAARKAEIESLKDALQILGSTTP
jgi:chromosome segregation ATPase